MFVSATVTLPSVPRWTTASRRDEMISSLDGEGDGAQRLLPGGLRLLCDPWSRRRGRRGSPGIHRTLTRRPAGGRRSEDALPSPNSLSTPSTPSAKSVTHVSGTKWNLCLGPLRRATDNYGLRCARGPCSNPRGDLAGRTPQFRNHSGVEQEHQPKSTGRKMLSPMRGGSNSTSSPMVGTISRRVGPSRRR
jgi:hypothetical protein